jgi:hypothetical protein
MQVTVKEFAESQGVDVGMANGVLNFLVRKGLSEVVGHRKSTSGKGKAASIYEIPENVQNFLASGKPVAAVAGDEQD